jgi:hypothetical protein
MSSKLRVVCRQVFLNMVHEFWTRLCTQGPLSKNSIEVKEGYDRPCAGAFRAGGEGGIRTPDTREGMPDFESGAIDRTLPPLRVW